MKIVPEGKVVYGMQLPIQAQSSLFVEEWEKGSGASELAAIARQADASGFFYIAVCDHVAIPRERATAMGTTWYDTIATLGYLAAVTSQVRLLSHVWVAAYRHPLQSAKSFATLDRLSNGRLIVGVGAGHVSDEFAALGVDFARRGRLLDEAIDALDISLREEFPSFAGPTWKAEDCGIGPRPVQQPRPPIWVGGSSPAALRRAGERGDGWLPQGTPRRAMPEQVAHVLEHRRRAHGDEAIDIGTVCEFLYVGTPSWDVGRGVISGDADQIAASLREFVGMGVNHLQVRFKSRSLNELLDQMEAFGRDISPLLA